MGTVPWAGMTPSLQEENIYRRQSLQHSPDFSSYSILWDLRASHYLQPAMRGARESPREPAKSFAAASRAAAAAAAAAA